MTIIDIILESLVLKHGAPFKPVDVSGCIGGTADASNAAGGLTRSGLSAPFKATGVCQMDEVVAAPIQEYWEGSWQQWGLIVIGLPALLVLAVAAFTLAHFSGTPLLGVGLGGIGLLLLVLKLPSFQTGNSEITSHEISWVAQKKWPGVTDERADLCFVSTLKGYGYSGFSSRTDTDFKAAMMAKRAYAEAYLARPEVADLCAKLAANLPTVTQ